MLDKPGEYSYVVAINLGLTHTEVSFSSTKLDPFSKFPVITDVIWPKCNPEKKTLMETKAVYFDKCLVDWGNGATTIQNEETIVTNFFLYLDSTKNKELPALPKNVTIHQVISDYLLKVFEYTYSYMKYSIPTLEKSMIRFCFTVPDNWNNEMKSILYQAAMKAEIIKAIDPLTRLVFASNTEALVLCCQSLVQDIHLGPQKTFLVCNINDETVDLCEYNTVINQNQDGLLTIENLTVKTNSLGTVSFTSSFKSYIHSVIDDAVGINGFNELTEYEVDDILQQFFEIPKHRFVDSSGLGFDAGYLQLHLPFRFYSIELRNMTYIDQCHLVIPLKEFLCQVFDPFIASIISLIDFHVENSISKIDGITIAGDHSEVPYLSSLIRARFYDPIPFIKKCYSPRSVTIRGTVLMGLNPNSIRY